jgi:hypothetical protein
VKPEIFEVYQSGTALPDAISQAQLRMVLSLAHPEFCFTKNHVPGCRGQAEILSGGCEFYYLVDCRQSSLRLDFKNDPFGIRATQLVGLTNPVIRGQIVFMLFADQKGDQALQRKHACSFGRGNDDFSLSHHFEAIPHFQICATALFNFSDFDDQVFHIPILRASGCVLKFG